MSTVEVGIAGLGSYLPGKAVDAWEAVRESGISREKFEHIGASEIHMAAPGEMPSDMAAEAGRRALADAGLEPGDLDLIIYSGSVKDHSRWQASNKVQADLQAFNSYVFDLYQGACGQNLALSIARDMMLADPELNNVLIAAAERWDTSLERPILGHSFVFGDGASAAVLTRDHPRLRLLSWAHTTRGEHHQAFCIPDVGAGTHLTPEVFARGGHLFQFYRPRNRSADATAAFVEEFNRQGRETLDLAAGRAGVSVSDIAFTVMLNSSYRHNKRFLELAGLSAKRSSAGFIADTGLLGTADVFYNLERARLEGLLQEGEPVAVYTVGGGYSWGASLLRA
ncbi:MAG TPA: 3-oxoacyl-[acyl-carrier-protein] synthase III C-terminal domain-containing protein [Myxococcota bacterium]|nr:3-oxoacyl-[acyl-carrier-protein] synthase III C-terminal domain-containing protein [Myxococcota bacterium]